MVRRERIIIVTLARLMDDMNPRRLPLQYVEASNHRLVDRMRSLASAKHQQSGRPTAFWRNLEKCLPHGHACHYGVTKIVCRLFKVDSRGRHKTGHYPISKSWHHVRLKGY